MKNLIIAILITTMIFMYIGNKEIKEGMYTIAECSKVNIEREMYSWGYGYGYGCMTGVMGEPMADTEFLLKEYRSMSQTPEFKSITE